MRRLTAKQLTTLAAASAFALALSGCGESGLQAMPADAPYVAPPSPGEMKPASKLKRMPKNGVPLGRHPAAGRPNASTLGA
ncbi:hypothetical protein [Paludisphaera mucosa]|uniref:Lipoprotein n=1 Tax=Paludisphaera mucosa TaxID=3030827 RepID=A0ABT6FJN1_9BACT|nr:hypothetical protein [Paludisphaera mucosa]MDG3007786.1 hypothetical protein [Paludisphaera mucosa]